MKCPHCGFVFDRHYVQRRNRFMAQRVDQIEWGKNIGKRILEACAKATSFHDGREVPSPIVTISDLVQHTFCSLPSCGDVSIKRIEQVLAAYDLRLATLAEWDARNGEVDMRDEAA